MENNLLFGVVCRLIESEHQSNIGTKNIIGMRKQGETIKLIDLLFHEEADLKVYLK